MKKKLLSDILLDARILEQNGSLAVPICGIAYDSRLVTPGTCFIAVRGAHADGLAYVDEAIARGAVAVVAGQPLKRRDIPWVAVSDERLTMAWMACRFWDLSIENIQVIGVTGTNGKTTVTGLLADILSAHGQVARVGTLGMVAGETKEKISLTTPEAIDLFSFLARANETSPLTHLVMEVSSVALVQRRLAGLKFDQAIFTSFSGDHLDFHGDMESYFTAKLSLFKQLEGDGWAVVNYDDPRCDQILEHLNCQYVTYGFSPDADIHPIKTSYSFTGTQLLLATPKGAISIVSPLIGRVNVYNLMAAIASAQICEVPPETIQQQIRAYGPIPGRLQMVCQKPLAVMVDYAHTDDALKSMLTSVREVCKGRVILVFGAGGNRDKSKRPRMAGVAAALADWVVLTNDNPRQEDAREIVKQIVDGFPAEFTAYQVELDRRAAIALALTMARPNDLVVVAGKGHEDYQIFADRTEHFDDCEVILELVNNAT